MTTRPNAEDAADERRREIVSAALELLDAEGLDRLSLRRLAAHLGMHAPGLYWYIDSKQALIDLMSKAIIEEGLAHVTGLAEGQTWEHWLVELACSARQALLAHRDGARVVAGSYLLQTTAITPFIERALEILEAAGFDRVMALGGTVALIRVAIGSAMTEQASPFHGSAENEQRRTVPPTIDAERWPRTADGIRRVFEGKVRGGDHMFRWGAMLVVRGLEQTIVR